jgi:single-strand DNA-binding protein
VGKCKEERVNNLNSILIEGNLVRDPELSYTTKGTAVCKFSVASNRFFKQEQEMQKEVSFFDVSTWARLAEVCGEYLKKGRGVRVVGRLKQDRWTDADGKGHSRIEIVAEHVEFKPQFKKADGKDGDEKAEGGSGGEQLPDGEQAPEEGELKEAASF